MLTISCRDEHHGRPHNLRVPSSLDELTYTPKVGTHADSLVAEAVVKGIRDFDLETAWQAVLKDATVPPDNDWNTS